MGIWLGDCHFQRFANDREPAGNLVTEALKNVHLKTLSGNFARKDAIVW